MLSPGNPLLTALTLTVHSSGPTRLLAWCVVGFCAGIGLFVYGFVLLTRRRLILDTPFSKVRSASLGLAEVSGLAVGPYLMISPITARQCYFYRTLAWEWKQRGRDKQWVKVAAESMHVPFFIDDNTGRMLVDPRGADLDLHRDFQQEFCDSLFTTKDPAPPNVREFLARHGIDTSNKIKVEEFCIKPKNSLFILGTVAENPGIEVGPQPIRDADEVSSFVAQGFSLSLNSLSFSKKEQEELRPVSPASQLTVERENRWHEAIRLTSTPAPNKGADMSQQRKVAAALAKARISNPAAWAATGVDSSTGAPVMADPSIPENGGGSASAAPATAFDPRPPVVMMKGENNKTFLISWRSQKEIATSLGWKCTLMIWGGPALALLCLYVFINIWHTF